MPCCIRWMLLAEPGESLSLLHSSIPLTEYGKPAVSQGQLKKTQIRRKKTSICCFLSQSGFFCVEGGVDLGDFICRSAKHGQGAAGSPSLVEGWAGS